MDGGEDGFDGAFEDDAPTEVKIWPYDALALDSAPTFDGQYSLHLGQTGHAVEEETAGRCAGIDGAGETLELNALLVLQAYSIDQIVYAADKLIQLANDSGTGVVFRSQPAGSTI